MIQGLQYNTGSAAVETALEGVTQQGGLGSVLVYYAAGILPEAAEATSPELMQTIIFIAAWVWAIGVIMLVAYNSSKYIRVSRRLGEAVLFKGQDLVHCCSCNLGLNRNVQIFTSDVISTPIVCGLFKQRIILPAGIVRDLSNLELKYIITHELVHIKRYDYIIKPLAFLTLCVHWFNPLMWLCFRYMQKDMEMSCDEKVLSVDNNDIRSEYAKSLVNIAIKGNRHLDAGLLAFGENSINSRIKGIMKFKKAQHWPGIIAVVLIMVFSLVLLTNGQHSVKSNNEAGGNSPGKLTEDIDKLLVHRSQYIADASNVGNLLNKLPYGDRKNGISLNTDSKPYGITINYTLDSADKQQNIKPVLLDNALVVFSLIENVDYVVFSIKSNEQHEYKYSREELQKNFDKDLWDYSADSKIFGEFLMNISFDIMVFPENYSPVMSSVPGLRIDTSLNAVYYSFDFNRKITAQNGHLLTWDVNTGKISELRTDRKSTRLNSSH